MGMTQMKTSKSKPLTESELIEESMRLGQNVRNLGDEVVHALRMGKPQTLVSIAKALGRDKRGVLEWADKLANQGVLESGYALIGGKRQRWFKLKGIK